MAEREGFEPPIPVKVCLISSQVHSTGLCHLSAIKPRNLYVYTIFGLVCNAVGFSGGASAQLLRSAHHVKPARDPGEVRLAGRRPPDSRLLAQVNSRFFGGEEPGPWRQFRSKLSRCSFSG